MSFQNVAHLITVELLRAAFGMLQKNASPGVDGVTMSGYRQDLEVHLEDLHRRLKEGRYRAQPVRRVFIAKENGKQRPLGIPSLEDKIVQRAVLLIVEPISEQDFLPCSHGFRRGRGAQSALDAVYDMIVRRKVNYILDADIKGYFDNIVRPLLMDLIAKRIQDRAILRLIGKWLNAGVIENGKLLVTSQGTPQGAVISPWMANVYLHYVLDLWVEQEIKPRLRGEIHLIRYADDFIVGFQYLDEAQRFLAVLKKRFARFGLELSEEKTRLIAFGRFAASDLRRQGRGKPPTFDFLGFTHICATNREGKFALHLKTMRKRLRRAMKAIAAWCQGHRHLKSTTQVNLLNEKLQGHYAYYGRRTNYASIKRFHRFVVRVWFCWLNRRSQRKHLTWQAYNDFLQRHPLLLPHVTASKVLHATC